MNKPHSDATLKTLPDDQQQQIITWLKTSSLAQTLQHIREELKIRTSRSALSRFYHWWQIANPLDNLNRSMLVLLDHEPDLSQLPVKIDRLCQVALARLLDQAHTEANPALLRQVIQMHIALDKSRRDQAKFEDDLRMKRYTFFHQAETDRASAREKTKIGRDLTRRENHSAKTNQLWRQTHTPATPSPSPSPPSSSSPSPSSSSSSSSSSPSSSSPPAPTPDTPHSPPATRHPTSAPCHSPPASTPIIHHPSSTIQPEPASSPPDTAPCDDAPSIPHSALPTPHSGEPAASTSHSAIRTPHSEVPHSEVPHSASMDEAIKGSEGASARDDLATRHSPPDTPHCDDAPSIPHSALRRRHRRATTPVRRRYRKWPKSFIPVGPVPLPGRYQNTLIPRLEVPPSTNGAA